MVVSTNGSIVGLVPESWVAKVHPLVFSSLSGFRPEIFAPSHESHAHTQRCHISHDIPIVFSRGPCVFIYLSIYLSIYLIIVASTRPAFQAPFALQRTTFLHRTASRLPRDLQDIPASFAIPDISSRAMSLSSTQLHWLSLYRLDHCCGSYPKS